MHILIFDGLQTKYFEIDRGEGVPIFRWDDNYRFGGDDFDDPTTNMHEVAP